MGQEEFEAGRKSLDLGRGLLEEDGGAESRTVTNEIHETRDGTSFKFRCYWSWAAAGQTADSSGASDRR